MSMLVTGPGWLSLLVSEAVELLSAPLIVALAAFLVAFWAQAWREGRKERRQLAAILATLIEELLRNYGRLSETKFRKGLPTFSAASIVGLHAGRTFLGEIGRLPQDQAMCLSRAYAGCEAFLAAAGEFDNLMPGPIRVHSTEGPEGHRRRHVLRQGSVKVEYWEYDPVVVPEDGDVLDPDFRRGRAFLRMANEAAYALACLEVALRILPGGGQRLDQYWAARKERDPRPAQDDSVDSIPSQAAEEGVPNDGDPEPETEPKPDERSPDSP